MAGDILIFNKQILSTPEFAGMVAGNGSHSTIKDYEA